MSVQGMNDVWLVLDAAGGRESHFRLAEFADRRGVCMVNRALLRGLEALRYALGLEVGREVAVRITHCLRTTALVRDADAAPDSMHSAKYGGIAVDLWAEEVVSGACVPQALVALVAGKIFDFVKGDYGDGHVHCDMRSIVGR